MLKLETNWEFVADTVMGGVSSGQVVEQVVDGRKAKRLTGTVSLENNGGFIQMASDIDRNKSGMDLGSYSGFEVDVFGNDEVYDLRVRTDDLERPWQSFRAPFHASAQWTSVRLPFSDFEAHKTDKKFDPSKLRRIGIVAVGRVFQSDISVSEVRLF